VVNLIFSFHERLLTSRKVSEFVPEPAVAKGTGKAHHRGTEVTEFEKGKIQETGIGATWFSHLTSNNSSGFSSVLSESPW
jgi:hypothetical protein